MENTETKKKLYEFAFLLPVGKDQEAMKAILTKHGFEVVRPGEVKDIKLAYEIKKQNVAQFGFYILTNNSAEEDAASAVDRATQDLNLEESVLRFMFLAYEEPKKEEEGAKPKKARKEEMIPKVDRMEHMSNEKLEETLEEILK